MIDAINIAIILAATVNAFLGIVIIARNRHNRSNRWFSLFTLAIVAWSATMIVYRAVDTYETALWWVLMLYASAIFIPATLFHFVYYFPTEEKKLKKIFTFLIWLPIVIITLLTCKTTFIIEGLIIPVTGEKIILWGPWFWVYNIYIISYFSLTYIILFIKYLKSPGVLKKQLKFIIFATVFTGILANISNLLLPSFGIFTFNWFGQIQAIFLVIFIFYAIIRYHLLDIKLIAIELFSALIPLALFADSATSKNQPEFLYKISLTIIVSFFSYLVVKSARKEIKSKEASEKLANELRRANEELRQLDKTKSEFLSIASHQLRTPVTAMKGYSSMILENDFGKTPKLIREAVQKIFQSSLRLSLMINDFLDISRIETGRMSYSFEKFNLDDLIKSAINDFGANNPKAQSLNLGFFTNANSIEINGDSNKIRQVVTNLLDNAFKYTEKGYVKVFLDKDADGKNILIKIEDTGIGIPTEAIPRLFQKFTRAENVSSVHTDGSGLGLYVARRIVEDHKGRIWAASPGQGKGSTFYIELPAA